MMGGVPPEVLSESLPPTEDVIDDSSWFML